MFPPDLEAVDPPPAPAETWVIKTSGLDTVIFLFAAGAPIRIFVIVLKTSVLRFTEEAPFNALTLDTASPSGFVPITPTGDVLVSEAIILRT